MPATDEVISNFYLAAAGLGSWSLPLRQLADKTNSQHGMIQTFSTLTPLGEIVGAYDDGTASNQVLTSYVEYVKENGDLRMQKRPKEPVPYQDTDVLTSREIANHGYYQDVLLPAGVLFGLCVEVRSLNGVIDGVSLQRSKNDGPYTESDIALFSRISLHIGKALAIAERFISPQKSTRPQFRDDNNTYAVVDDEARVLMMTTRFLEDVIQDTNGGFCIRGEKLATCNGYKLDLPGSLLRSRLGRSMKFHYPGSQKILGLAPYLSKSADYLPFKRHIIWLENSHSRTKENVLMTRYRMTKSEVAVALLLEQGVNINGISELRQTARGTVRHQVKSILAKSNTNSQIEFVALLSRLWFDHDINAGTGTDQLKS
jgi:DNA-binding CsgD family transcriptional regulator